MSTTTELMRQAMKRHSIRADDLLVMAREVALRDAERDARAFIEGGPISLHVAAAIVMLIAEKRR